MGIQINLCADLKGLILKNPEHPTTREEEEALASRREAQLESIALLNQGDFGEEDRGELLKSRIDVYKEALVPLGVNFDGLIGKLREGEKAYISGLEASIKRRKARWATLANDRFSDLVFTVPTKVDPYFWWAETTPILMPRTEVQWRDDGMHVTGSGPKVDDRNGTISASVGAVARFALQPERIPESKSGRYLSSPHVELFGGLVLHAPDTDWFQITGVASCNLFLKQTIYKWLFGPPGSGPKIVAQQSSGRQLLYLEEAGFSRHVEMPGFELIPAVSFTNQDFNNTVTLWADVEVRLDIRLRAAGALCWCDPEILLRHFQWPLQPI
ncbi:hypothetical protein D3880_00635 [Pseudomonas cavernae]|uniref:Uncharacterized protein n=1 Tax=Pseudomonas cavernae TaxID=2320867 RepID=A0A385YXI2_9PSED|nr:hypothetical protein [Pseudomonas cavernae]AYC30980.1 hypothetical protein D3880_00635 [Pseudomonas cavernae]